jgi:hypothetical protein
MSIMIGISDKKVYINIYKSYTKDLDHVITSKKELESIIQELQHYKNVLYNNNKKDGV